MVINLLIGLCTPPVGFLIYLTASIADCSSEDVVRESIPFIIVLLVVLFICTYVPSLVMALPTSSMAVRESETKENLCRKYSCQTKQ